MDFSKRVFADFEINSVNDLPLSPNSGLMYQINQQIVVPIGKAGAGQTLVKGIVAWDNDRGDGLGEWVSFGSGSGFLSKIVNLSSDATLNDSATLYVVESDVDILVTPNNSLKQEPSFFYLNSIGLGNVTIENGSNDITILAGSRAGIIYDNTLGGWRVFIVDNGSTASISHFVGFYSLVNATDSQQVDFFLEIFPITVGGNIDLTKYNLTFEDGTASWRIVAGAVTIEQTASLSGAILEY